MQSESFKGIRQLLEKKQGLFRNNLMSSRVNNSCRTVISPDPSLETNELLLPVRFAKKLTFPESLSPYNLHLMQDLVRRGPSNYPGAVRVVFENNNTQVLIRSHGAVKAAPAGDCCPKWCHSTVLISPP